jgi:hypothetical protein
MNAENDLERRLADFYEAEAPPRAPDWVLGAVLETVDTTPQRRVRLPVPWRLPTMNTYAKWAIAAVVVVAVGAIGLAALRPGPAPNVGGQPNPSPTLSPSPSPSPDPSAPPPLNTPFTSTIHGISIKHPEGWVAVPATKPWVPGTETDFMGPEVDYIHDPVLLDHLFLGLRSQPLAGKTPDQWITDAVADPEGCDTKPTGSVTIDGADGRLCDSYAVVSKGDRGYTIRLYTSEEWLSNYYDEAWFRSVLGTIRLTPENANDVPPAASASAS